MIRQTPSAAPDALVGGSATRRLITIRFSHFCEKARWALDRARLSYVEEAHPPIVSWAYTKRIVTEHGRGRQVPILIADEKVYGDSNAILRYVDAHTPGDLAPLSRADPDEAQHAALRKLFDEGLGPAARRYVYGYLLDDTQLAVRVFSSAGTPLDRQVARTTFPMLRAAIRRGLKIDAAGIERSRKVIERVFATVEDLVRDGRRYLLGDTFSASDLSFASLAAPLLLPEAYASFCIPLEEAPRALVPIVEAYRCSPAGRFAMSLYERERGPTRKVVHS